MTRHKDKQYLTGNRIPSGSFERVPDHLVYSMKGYKANYIGNLPVFEPNCSSPLEVVEEGDLAST